MLAEINRAVALSSKYGLRALVMYCDSSVDTPEIDETAENDAVGIVITLAAIVIALYMTAIIVGSFGKTVAPGTYNATSGVWESGTGSIGLPHVWNNTVNTLDSNANSSFSMAGILPVAIVGVGILTIIIAALAMR